MELETNDHEQVLSKEPTLKEKTAKGLFWGGISNFVQQLIGMVFGMFIARILLPEDYGLVTMLAIFPAISNTIMDSGFSIALVNKETIAHKDYNAVFWFNLLVGIGMYFVLFLFAPLIANFFDQPVLTNLSRILFLSFLISSAGIAHNSILLKKMQAKQRGIIDMASVFLSGSIGLFLAFKGFAFWGLAFQQVIQSLTSVLLRWYFSRWKPTFEFDFSQLKNMFAFSIKLFLTNVLSQISSNLFPTIVGKLYGKIETGYYAQGSKWAGYGNAVVVSTINSIAHPVLVEAKTDIPRQLQIFRKMLRFGGFLSFPAMLGLAFVSRDFILIFLGEKWINSVIYLQLYCIWGINGYLVSLYLLLIYSHGKSDIYLKLTLILFVSQLIGLLVCSPFGVLVMVYIFLGLYLCSTFLWQYYANKLIGLKIKDIFRDLFPYFAATIFSIGIAWCLSILIDNIYLKFAVKCISMIAIYCLILWRANSIIFKEGLNYLKGSKI